MEQECVRKVLEERFMEDLHDSATLHPIFKEHEQGFKSMLNYVGLDNERAISGFLKELVSATKKNIGNYV